MSLFDARADICDAQHPGYSAKHNIAPYLSQFEVDFYFSYVNAIFSEIGSCSPSIALKAQD